MIKLSLVTIELELAPGSCSQTYDYIYRRRRKHNLGLPSVREVNIRAQNRDVRTPVGSLAHKIVKIITIDRAKVLRATRRNMGHFGEVIPVKINSQCFE